ERQPPSRGLELRIDRSHAARELVRAAAGCGALLPASACELSIAARVSCRLRRREKRGAGTDGFSLSERGHEALHPDRLGYAQGPHGSRGSAPRCERDAALASG